MEGSREKKLLKPPHLKLKTIHRGTFMSNFKRLKGLKNYNLSFFGSSVHETLGIFTFKSIYKFGLSVCLFVCLSVCIQ